MSLKLWIAKKLAPEVFRKADRYERMQREISLDHWWLAHDFPEVSAFAQRALANDANYWRDTPELAVDCKYDGDIGRFREQLRSGVARA